MVWKTCKSCKGSGKKKTTDPVTGQLEKCDACRGDGGIDTRDV